MFDMFEEKNILAHVKEVAPYLEAKLQELVEKYDILKETRGLGLMRALEFKVPVAPYVSKALEKLALELESLTEEELEKLEELGIVPDAIDALSLANEAGSSKAVNIVLMGRLAKYFDIPYEKWIAAIENTVAPKFIEMNKKAFALGYNA